jgi:hypothetical protein
MAVLNVSLKLAGLASTNFRPPERLVRASEPPAGAWTT